MGEYSGSAERPRFTDRGFRRIGFDNFDQVLEELKPRASFKISSGSTGGEMTVDLIFRALGDFQPERVIEQIAPLDSLRKSDSPEALQTIARHLDRVLHAPEFKALESAWRSLWYPVSHTETSDSLQVRMLDVSKHELLRDFRRAPEFNQTRLFKLLYEEPYGQLSADPYGLLVGDFFFSPSAEDVALLETLASIASACHAPFIAGAAASMLGLESFASLGAPRDLARNISSTEFARWRAFRESADALYVGLAVPRWLVRSPHGIRPEAPGDFRYDEELRGSEDLLWGNTAILFATCVANAFARHGWCGAIRGVEGGGIVEGLPTWISHAENEFEVRSTLEASITERHEKEFCDLGFLPLMAARGTDYAVFFSVPTCAKPREYNSDTANIYSRLSCQLPYVLTASRFAHYLKAIARASIISYHTRGDWENYFNRWISSYISLDDDASPATRARRPLREARIEVAEDPGKPGSYRLVAFLRPTFQLKELPVSLRVVTCIP
jgi:type VI secretion system protein ImpC